MGAAASVPPTRSPAYLRDPSCHICRSQGHASFEGGPGRVIGASGAPGASRSETGRCSGRAAGAYPPGFSARMMQAVAEEDAEGLKALLKENTRGPSQARLNVFFRLGLSAADDLPLDAAACLSCYSVSFLLSFLLPAPAVPLLFLLREVASPLKETRDVSTPFLRHCSSSSTRTNSGSSSSCCR